MLQRSRNVSRLRLCAVKVWAPEEQQATGGGHKQGKKGVKHTDGGGKRGCAPWTGQQKETLCVCE